MLPSEITSSEDLDDLFNAFGSAGIEVVDSDKAPWRQGVRSRRLGRRAGTRSHARRSR